MSKGRSSLLLEIIIVLLFFALSGAVVLGMFLKAGELSASGRALGRALFAAQDAVEGLRASDEPEQYLASVGFAPSEPGGWRKTDKTDRSPEILINLADEALPAGRLWSVEVSVHDREKRLTSLSASWYVPDKAVAE